MKNKLHYYIYQAFRMNSLALKKFCHFVYLKR